MTLKELEERLKNLEDKDEIQKLQRAYCYYIEHWDGQQMLDLFSDSPDVSVEAGDMGVFAGQEGIKSFMLAAKAPPEFLHVLMPIAGIVDVDSNGKMAKGRWYGFGPQAKIMKGVWVAQWLFGIYENVYVKEGGKWKFKEIHWFRIFMTPYEDGWVKTPVADTPFIRNGAKPKPTTVYGPYPSGHVFPYHYKNPVSGK